MLEYKGIHYETNPKVYEPAEDTFLFAENLQIERKDRVLEIGTGTGLIAIIASKNCSTVIATDVNPHAIDCAVKNLIANKSYNVELRKGNLFEPIKNKQIVLKSSIILTVFLIITSIFVTGINHINYYVCSIFYTYFIYV